jgi:GT2 family glycosyltransferase
VVKTSESTSTRANRRAARPHVVASPLLATVIVSVYKDVAALRCILFALAEQTEKRFQTIISEDGESPDMADFIAAVRPRFPNLVHLTQEDRGFRKTKALNRAVVAAAAERLIFLDGDCVPHRCFVANHLRQAEPRTVCVGRRVQLGPRVSRGLRRRPSWLLPLQHRLCYLLLAPLLYLDGTRNYETGFVSPLLQALQSRKRRFLLGCNFSCARHDLLAINGFNEDYVYPRAGEDTDIEWRLERRGIRLKSVRFVAPVYHLHHPASWTTHAENERILAATKQREEVFCRNGIVKS